MRVFISIEEIYQLRADAVSSITLSTTCSDSMYPNIRSISELVTMTRGELVGAETTERQAIYTSLNLLSYPSRVSYNSSALSQTRVSPLLHLPPNQYLLPQQ